MNGYSKIKIIGTATHSRSMDLSDLLSSSSSSSVPRKSISKSTASTQKPEAKIPETNHKSNNPTNPQQDYSFSDQQESNNFGSGVKLSRTASVSSASVAVQSAVKRAFSMRRSSSVSERYRRIHDQPMILASPIDDHDSDGGGAEIEAARSVKKKHSKRKILKACKRLLGL